jgi:hypothetical protein
VLAGEQPGKQQHASMLYMGSAGELDRLCLMQLLFRQCVVELLTGPLQQQLQQVLAV